MRQIPVIALFFLLSGCGGWPDVPGTAPQSRGGAWPELLPMSEIMDASTTGIATDEAAAALAARADALRRRAWILRSPVEDDAAFEALRRRIGG